MTGSGRRGEGVPPDEAVLGEVQKVRRDVGRIYVMVAVLFAAHGLFLVSIALRIVLR